MAMNKNSKHCCECDETPKWAMLQNKAKLIDCVKSRQCHSLEGKIGWQNTSVHCNTCVAKPRAYYN